MEAAIHDNPLCAITGERRATLPARPMWSNLSYRCRATSKLTQSELKS
jgi:hypothetical protein